MFFMEVISYIIFWELMCVSISFAGIWNILKSRRKTGRFLLISGIALLASMFIILFPYISVIFFYPLIVFSGIAFLTFSLVFLIRKKL